MAGNFIERSRHGTVFYFRRRVPGDLRARIGQSFIYVTLRTEVRREAVMKARALAAHTDQIFQDLRAMSGKNDDDLFRTEYVLRIDLDALTGKRKSVVFTDVKPGEAEEVAALAQSLTGGGSASSASMGTPTIREAMAEVAASKDLKPSTRKEYARHGIHLAEFFGKDTRLGDIDQAKFATFTDAIRARDDWADKTKNSVMVNCARLFNRYTGRNTAVPPISAKGLKIKRSRPAGHDRDAFTIDELRWLIENAARYRTKQPSKWWITVATAFLGCRIEELAQADLANDLYRDQATGAMVLKITEEAEDEAAPSKSVKTFAGWRKVPLHPALEEAGFVRFIEAERAAGATTLFERQWAPWRDPATGGVKRSHSAVKWGGRELEKLRKSGVITRGKQTYFHSLRHSFTTLLASAGIHDEWRSGLAGQAYGGVNSQIYNKAKEDVSQTLPMLFDALKPLEAILRDVGNGDLPQKP